MSFSSRDLSKRMKKAEGVTVKHARRFIFRRLDNFREVRRHIAIWVLAIGVIVGASGLQLMWYQQSYRTIASANDGTYAEGVLGPVETLNPIFATTSAEASAGNLLFSKLLKYDNTGHLNYDLADSLKISEDGKTYTVTLRADARWTDGLFVRARDVVYTVNLLKNPATRSPITGWDKVTATVVDDRTVSFSMSEVYSPFPHALAILPILPEHTLRDIDPGALRENAFSSNPQVTSGPFRLRFVQEVDQTHDRKIIHLARNQGYYQGASKIDRFQLHVYTSGEAITKGLNTGEVNAATDMTVTDSQVVDTTRYTVEYRPINSGVYALLNTTSQITGDAKVRQALRAATDTKAIREALGGSVPELYLPFVSGQLSGEAPAAPVFDKARAAALLDEAGWKLDGTTRKKDGKSLTLSVVTVKNNDYERALDVLADQWRAVGVGVTTTIVDPTDRSQNVFQNILQPRNFDVLLNRVTIGGDPDVSAYWHSSQAASGSNYSNYSNAISDEALISASNRIEPDLRNAKYLAFSRQWLSDVPAIGLYQATMQYAHSKKAESVTERQVLVAAADRYADVLYWTVGERLVHQTP